MYLYSSDECGLYANLICDQECQCLVYILYNRMSHKNKLEPKKYLHLFKNLCIRIFS